MKIIKPGIPKSERVYTAICRECNCEFSFTRGEAHFHSDQRDGDSLTVRCPQTGCGREVWVPA